MFKKGLIGLGRFTVKALPVVVALFLEIFVSVGDHKYAKMRAAKRARNKYGFSGNAKTVTSIFI